MRADSSNTSAPTRSTRQLGTIEISLWWGNMVLSSTIMDWVRKGKPYAGLGHFASGSKENKTKQKTQAHLTPCSYRQTSTIIVVALLGFGIGERKTECFRSCRQRQIWGGERDEERAEMGDLIATQGHGDVWGCVAALADIWVHST